jgi:hypothetical protein
MKNLTLHSHCRTCSHFHIHSFHHSKTFSDDEIKKQTQQTTKDERFKTQTNAFE